MIRGRILFFVLIYLVCFIHSERTYSIPCPDVFNKRIAQIKYHSQSTSYRKAYKKFKRLKIKISNPDGIIKGKYRELLVPLIFPGVETLILTRHLLTDFTPKTRKEIAQQLSITQSRVRIIEHTVMNKINRALPNILRLRSKLLKDNGVIKNMYMGIEGHAQFAKEYFNGSISEAYDQASLSLTMKMLNQLKWIRLSMTTRKFQILMGWVKMWEHNEAHWTKLLKKLNKLLNNPSIADEYQTVSPFSSPRLLFIFRENFTANTPLTYKQIAQRYNVHPNRISTIGAGVSRSTSAFYNKAWSSIVDFKVL